MDYRPAPKQPLQEEQVSQAARVPAAEGTLDRQPSSPGSDEDCLGFSMCGMAG